MTLSSSNEMSILTAFILEYNLEGTSEVHILVCLPSLPVKQ